MPIRIGVIGIGWWAVKNHIPMLQALPEVEVTAICGLGQEKLKSVPERFGIRFGTEDYRELLSSDRLDGVVVSSPHRFHYEHAAAGSPAPKQGGVRMTDDPNVGIRVQYLAATYP